MEMHSAEMCAAMCRSGYTAARDLQSPSGSFSWEISEKGPAMSVSVQQHFVVRHFHSSTSNDKWNNGPVITASTASHSKSSALNQYPL
ncbi:uncharacterized protein Bfra_003107 [Botrytis fragariae]|uniref:Uncharacterized protein n=1 Tax=Botrytis fragariae TaxID=1964551 RepID=A0A8H6AZL6_9HELO|nr:uncharacterized protein Bfra_003107 [Botrytis fragariae]KAF5876701.1 hypothetical protein Bfra_003107 [Botrytis fragariae]